MAKVSQSERRLRVALVFALVLVAIGAVLLAGIRLATTRSERREDPT